MSDAGATRIGTSFGPGDASARDVLVLGLGNTLLADDGVGVHVVRQLASDPDAPPGLHPLDGGNAGIPVAGHAHPGGRGHRRGRRRAGRAAGTVRLLDQHAFANVSAAVAG